MNWSKFFFCTGAALCLPLYIYHCIFNTDPATGFFAQKGFLTVLYCTLLSICLAGTAAAGLLGKNAPSITLSKKPLLGGISLVLAVMAALQGLFSAKDYLIFMFSFAKPMDAVVFQPFSLVTALIQLIAAIAGALGFLLLGTGYFKGKGTTSAPLALFGPPVWSGIFTAQMFMAYPQIASFPDRALWFTCLVFFALFLVGQSRILLGEQKEKGCRWVAAFGLCCGLTGFVLTGGTVLSLRFHTTLPWFHLLFAPFSALYAMQFLLGEKKCPNTMPPPEETPSTVE